MKKSVLFTINHLVVGGVETILLNTLDKIDYSKYDVTLLLWRKGSEWENRVSKNVKIVHIEQDNYKKNLRQFRLRTHHYKRLLLGQHYDIEIIYRHDLADVYYNFWDKKAKKIVWVHGDIFYHQPFKNFLKTPKGRIIKHLQYKVYKQADAIVCVGNNVQESFDEYWTKCKGKTCVIQNGIDVNNMLELSQQDCGIDGGYFVTVGRCDKNKNVIDVIKAFEIIKTSYPQYKLVVVGDGVQRQEMEDYVVENGFADKVEFVGAQVNPYKYIKGAKLFLFASVEEAFGIAPAEAMALGVPVISYNNRGVVSFAQGACVLVNMTHQDLATGAIAILADENKHRQLIELGYKRAEESDINIVMNNIEKLLDR